MPRIEDSLLAEMAELLDAGPPGQVAIPSYLHANPILRWMAWRRVEILERHLIAHSRNALRNRDNAMLMDFGCGTGVLLDTASAHFGQVYAVDRVLDPVRLLATRRAYRNLQPLLPAQANERIPDHSLDVIVAAEVLEHILQLGDTLSFFARKIRRDGKLFITVPTESRLYRLGRRMAGFKEHFHVANASTVNQKILQSGFGNAAITKIPLGRPFDIFWLIAYDPG